MLALRARSLRFGKIGVEQDGSLAFRAREEMAVAIERHGDRRVAHEGLQRLRFTPAAIIRLANVWRHSCSVIGFSLAVFHARLARSVIQPVDHGLSVSRPNTSPVELLRRCSIR